MPQVKNIELMASLEPFILIMIWNQPKSGPFIIQPSGRGGEERRTHCMYMKLNGPAQSIPVRDVSQYENEACSIYCFSNIS